MVLDPVENTRLYTLINDRPVPVIYDSGFAARMSASQG